MIIIYKMGPLVLLGTHHDKEVIEGGVNMNAAPAATSGNNVVAILAAIYSIVLCILQVCAGTLAGVLSGGLNSLSTAVTEAGGTVGADVGQATGATGIMAILLILAGVAMLISAVGVFMRRPWAWMLTIAAHGAYVVIAVLSGSLSAGALAFVFIGLSIAVVAAFLLMPDIKRALNVA